ncbi:hypothetical protein ESOMN_v1c00840 [Williamsoniiplasma somnilux]|uniref:Uncharacterized protein n=1 Tax=Williamsoniiplasma somnilux TaxID=215578 RepID=A0A2K8NXC3_9MOLU|nr:hypothetical protein [Williamsoniiplasma somnilux]ATZ18469.1 hypothetical protein ESOMN_v1c00840 [Williamsoniiplasma somnilux]
MNKKMYLLNYIFFLLFVPNLLMVVWAQGKSYENHYFINFSLVWFFWLNFMIYSVYLSFKNKMNNHGKTVHFFNSIHFFIGSILLIICAMSLFAPSMSHTKNVVSPVSNLFVAMLICGFIFLVYLMDKNINNILIFYYKNSFKKIIKKFHILTISKSFKTILKRIFLQLLISKIIFINNYLVNVFLISKKNIFEILKSDKFAYKPALSFLSINYKKKGKLWKL